jgi:siroheme synthase-like protein
VLVVGGGPVAERKVESLVDAGATVTVISPDATARLRDRSALGEITLHLRRFQESDLDGVTLAISATDDASVQREIAALAASKNVLVNTVDQPSLCDFIAPAVLRRGDVVAAISTSGSSPALAAALRDRIRTVLTEDVERAAKLLGSIREDVHQRFVTAEERKSVFERIIGSGILDWIHDCDDATALERIRRIMDETGTGSADSTFVGPTLIK